MDVVIDVNVFIAALISPQGHTADLFFSDELHLYSPEFLMEELEEHKQEIWVKTHMSEEGIQKVLRLLTDQIRFVPLIELLDFLPRIKKICPDPDDVEYLALALKQNCPLWSNDKRLKSQDKVKVFSTSELIQFLS